MKVFLSLNINYVDQDSRFDDEVDRITGYHTETLLCMPVKNAYDEIIAVAQVINKNPEVDCGYFTKKDEKIFETYLQFVGIAITNAQIMETSRQEYDRNRVRRKQGGEEGRKFQAIKNLFSNDSRTFWK